MFDVQYHLCDGNLIVNYTWPKSRPFGSTLSSLPWNSLDIRRSVTDSDKHVYQKVQSTHANVFRVRSSFLHQVILEITNQEDSVDKRTLYLSHFLISRLYI